MLFHSLRFLAILIICFYPCIGINEIIFLKIIIIIIIACKLVLKKIKIDKNGGY